MESKVKDIGLSNLNQDQNHGTQQFNQQDNNLNSFERINEDQQKDLNLTSPIKFNDIDIIELSQVQKDFQINHVLNVEYFQNSLSQNKILKLEYQNSFDDVAKYNNENIQNKNYLLENSIESSKNQIRQNEQNIQIDAQNKKNRISLRRYKSSSIDENEFIDYIEDPALRLEFDAKRQKCQQREINNTDQFKLIKYGFHGHKSKCLLKIQAESLKQAQNDLMKKQQQIEEEELPKYASVSLCCISSSNPFRNTIILFVTKNPWFDRFILLIILLNTLFLALDQEVDIVTYYDNEIDFTFLIIYTIEMILKIIALGFFMNINSYLRDPWNILDFTVVVCGWISQDSSIQGIQYVKILRILRPLKVIKKISGMPKLVKTIIDSLPVMFDVFILFLFSVLFFAIIATQTIGGDLEKSCTGIIDGKSIIKLGDKNERFLCQDQQTCDDLTNSNKYQGGPFVCQYAGNPWNDQLSYDNIFMSVLNVFITIALEGWMDQMYWVRSASSSTNFDMFFVVQVFLGNFIILVLLINVQAFYLDQAFDNDEKIQHEKFRNFQQKIYTDQLYEKQLLDQIQDKNFDENQQQDVKLTLKQKYLKINEKITQKIPHRLIQYSNIAENFCDNNEYFGNSIIIIIILNTLFMASEYYDQADWLTLTQQNANYVFTAAFTVEMFIKMFGKGLYGYFADNFNTFDCFVVLMSYLDIALSQTKANLGIIKAFRLLRIFKLIQKWPKFQKLISTLKQSIKPIINLGILMILYLFISALLMKNICQGQLVDENGDSSPYGWNTTSQSLITMFIMLTGDNWIDIMHLTVSSQNNNVWLSLLIVFLFGLGHFMLLNLFLAVLLRAIETDVEEQENKEIEEVQQHQAKIFEEKEELEYLQNQFFAEIKLIQQTERSAQNQDQAETERLFLQKKNAFLEKLQKIENQFNDNKDNSIIEIEKEIENEIKEGRKRVIDLDQSDVEIEFQIIQNHLFENCENLKKNEDGEIVNSLNILEHLTQMLQKKREMELAEQNKIVIPDFSLFIFSKDNKIRAIATQIIENPYFDSFINHIIALSCILIALDQPEQPYSFGQEDAPYWPQQPVVQDKFQKQAISFLINITSFIFVVEFILKVISKGFYIGDKSYLKDPFNILDFIIVIFSVLTWILEQLVGKYNDYVKMFRSLRAVRPLRFISQNKSLKMVVNSIFKSLPELFSVTLIVILFILVFGILGVQLFKGELGKCSIVDDSIQTKEQCLSYGTSLNSSLRLQQSNSSNFTSLNLQNFTIQNNSINLQSLNNSNLTSNQSQNIVQGQINITQNQSNNTNNNITQQTANQNNSTGNNTIQQTSNLNNQTNFNNSANSSQTTSQEQILTTEWQRQPQNYDNIFWSMLTFYEVSTFEGWSQMMFDATNGVGYDIVMQENSQDWVQLIYILYIFIMGFFVMNLFISVIVEKFQDEYREYDGSRNLQSNETEWVKIQKLMLLTEPKIVPLEPVNRTRRFFYNLVQSQIFDYLSIIVISLNAVFFCIYHAYEPQYIDFMLYISNIVIIIYFIFEIILKIIAYGFSIFWSQIWNKFDMIIIGFSLIGLFQEYFSVDVSILKIFRVFRLLRIIKDSQGIRKLLKTLLMSLRNIVNVFILLILLWFVFSIIGMNLFSKLQFGDVYNQDANFTSFYISMLLIIRCSTGGAWTDIMHEMYDSIGSKVLFYWVFFTLIVMFVLMNVFIAVIGKTYDENQENTDLNDVLSIKKKDLKNFVNTWAKFNPQGEHMMKTLRLPEFLMELPTPLGYKGISLNRHMIDQIIFCLNIRDRGGVVYYPEVMWAIFHAIGGYNTQDVLNCQENKTVLKEVKKKFQQLSYIEKYIAKFNFKKMKKEVFKEVEKIKVTLNSLCGNKYLIDEFTAFQYIKALRGFQHFKKRKNYQQQLQLDFEIHTQ